MEQHKKLNALSGKFAEGRIDRRQFMRGAMALGASVSLAGALADQAQAATSKRGGTLTMGVGHGSTTDTLDPGTYINDFTISMAHGFNGYLTQINSDTQLEPSIAESWEVSQDAKTWVFKIRKDVEFHNGRTVTAADVVASMNHHRGENSTSSAKPLLESVVDVKADGADSVVFELGAGNADFDFFVSDYHMPIMPANDDGSMDWSQGIGCGSYKLDRFEPGVVAELSKHGNHWDDSVGHVDHVVQLALLDANARTTALLTGDVDAIDRVDLKTAQHLARKPDLTIHNISGTQHYTFPMLATLEPFKDNNVRQALKWAINRQELVDKILFGYGYVGNDHPIGKGQRFFNTELEQKEHDPDKARFFLKQAGLDGLEVSINISDAAFVGAIDSAVLIKDAAAKCGMTVNVVREPNDGYWADVWQKKGWFGSYWGGRPVEDMMFTTAFKGGAAWNEGKWSDERFDKMLVEARAELDENKRRGLYFEMQAIVANEGSVAVPMFASYVFATSGAVGHPEKIASNSDRDGNRYMERWWKA